MSKLDKSTIAWKKKRFDEVAVIANGQVDPRIEPYCREIHIGPENIESHTGRIINLQKAEELGLISGKYVFDENSIIYSKIRPNLNKLCQPSFRGICSADMYPIWAKEEIKKSYLYYFMQSPAFYNQAIKSSMRTGIPKINRQDLNRIKITYPVDHAIQNRIVNTISVWDNAIEKTEALIAAKEKQFDWLCQTYFKPGNSTNSSWEKHKIATFVTVRNEREVPSEEAPLYSLTIENGVTAKTDRYNREFLVIDKGGKKYKVVHPKDIVFNPANLRWGAIARSEVEHKVVLSPIYEVLKVDENKIDSDFLTHALTCSRQIAIFATMVEGTLVERMAVKIDTFLSCHIYVPSSKEKQKEIAHVLNLSKQEISLLENTLEQYRSQKRGLMQKLLTGEWQVGSSQHLSEETYQELSREGVA